MSCRIDLTMFDIAFVAACTGLIGLCCPSVPGAMLACCDLPAIDDEWLGYMYNIHAVINRDLAWEELQTLNSFGIGGSLTNSLFWAASRSAPPINYNSSVHTPAFIMEPSCSANSACQSQGNCALSKLLSLCKRLITFFVQVCKDLVARPQVQTPHI
jgi:hypothetical protein